jgi:hypothetical protein
MTFVGRAGRPDPPCINFLRILQIIILGLPTGSEYHRKFFGAILYMERQQPKRQRQRPQQQKYPRQKPLDQLPDQMIENIAKRLDKRSVRALASTSNRIRQVA